MYKVFLVLPVSMALILGVATQMQEIAESTAQKAILFSDDMNEAMECATKGIPISVCSPQLMEHNFDEEQEQFEQALSALEDELVLYLNLSQEQVINNESIIVYY